MLFFVHIIVLASILHQSVANHLSVERADMLLSRSDLSGQTKIFPVEKLGKPVQQPDTTTYSTTGWVAETAFTDSTCSVAALTEGLPVNTCHLHTNTTSFKYQLTKDGCENGIIQFFSDTDCLVFDSAEALTAPDGCTVRGIAAFTKVCTTSTTQYVPELSLVTTFYEEGDCTVPGSYLGFSTQVCQVQNIKYTCDDGHPEVVYYIHSDCQDEYGTNEIGDECVARSANGYSESGDDHYYTPGSNANAMYLSCINGASSSSSSTSLSAAEIAGVVVGGVAFLVCAGMLFLFLAGLYCPAGSSAAASTSASGSMPATVSPIIQMESTTAAKTASAPSTENPV